MKARRAAGIIAATLMIIVGIGVMLYPTLSDLKYTLAQQGLAAAADRQTADTGGQHMPSGAVARLVISKIKLDAYVLDGTDADSLAKGPGHYEETPLPGEKGNAAIAGHRTMYGHPFRHLDKLAEGDQIVTYTEARKGVYRVIETTRVDPSDVSVIAPTEDDRLTLTTCDPVGSARQRLVVVAELVN